MKFVIVDGYDQLSRHAALMAAGQIAVNPSVVLGLATGESPLGLYRELVKLHREYGLDFQRVRTFNLDEYCGLPPSHPQSYAHYMRMHLFENVNLQSSNAHLLDGVAPDQHGECIRYEEEIKSAGGIDFQILGIGKNGHIAFNEPGDSFQVRTGVFSLSEATREANSRFFESGDSVPSHALSVGIGTIMKAREILMIASGSEKAYAVAASIFSPIDPRLPASILKIHPRFTLLVDRAAARDLLGKDLSAYQ
ncbi:MAG: glucosamine-6-phosphate deaminase [Candidatus Riflebacteria bacterium]|nr:glucosamine-6-phosphate deaminase [Candidatus Riflebacteria bacterium]